MEEIKKSPEAVPPGQNSAWVYSDKLDGVSGRWMLDNQGRRLYVHVAMGLTCEAIPATKKYPATPPTTTHNISLHLSEEMAFALHEALEMLLIHQNPYTVCTVEKNGTVKVLYGERIEERREK